MTNMRKKYLILLFLFCMSCLMTFGQGYKELYVGQSAFFVAPDPPGGGAINQTAWGCSHSAVSCSQQDPYSAKVTVNEYFEGTAEIQCDYYWYWYDNYGYMHTNHATTYFHIKCKPVTINLRTNDMYLTVGEGQTISYTLSPSISPTPTIRMSSRNTNVATVSSNGYVRAIGPGVTYINLRNSAGPDAVCTVHVEKIDPTSISIPSSLAAYVGESANISATIYPSNASTTLSWYSEDSDIASVSSGRVTGYREGTTYIYARTSNGLASNKCRVDVAYRKPTSVELSPSALRLPISQTSTLKATISPTNARYTLSWSSDNPDVVSVSPNGVVTAHEAGTTVIRVTTDNGRSDYCTVTVPADPERVELAERISLLYGKSRSLNYTVYPSDAYVSLSWSSSNPKVARVSSDGEVTACAPGVTDITVRTSNGRQDVCRVEVEAPLFHFKVWRTDDSAISYNMTEHPKITYQDGKLSIRTFSGSLVLDTALVHKFTIEDNSRDRMPESISMQSELELAFKSEAELNVTLLPENYDIETELTWTSDNPEVVRVTDGLIKAVGVGEANITVTASNGTKAVCRVNVPEPDYHIFVWHYDGSYDAFSFREHPVITCDGTTVKVVTRFTEIEFEEADVHKYTFSDSKEPIITEIGSVPADGQRPRMKYKNDCVWIQGCAPGSLLRLFTLDGRGCGAYKVSADGRAEFNLSGLPVGIYILKTETITYKIIKK